jgi:hypothetical protein
MSAGFITLSEVEVLRAMNTVHPVSSVDLAARLPSSAKPSLHLRWLRQDLRRLIGKGCVVRARSARSDLWVRTARGAEEASAV